MMLEIWSKASPDMTPATPAIAEPMKKVMRDRAVDVDAEHLRRLAVGGDGAHRLAEQRAVDQHGAGRTSSPR